MAEPVEKHIEDEISLADSLTASGYHQSTFVHLERADVWGRPRHITGNTGGANVWFFKSTPIPNDLQQIIDLSKQQSL